MPRRKPGAAKARWHRLLSTRRPGETLSGLAKRHDVNYQTLCWWRRRIEEADGEAQGRSPTRLIPVDAPSGSRDLAELLGLGSSRQPFEVALTSGQVVRVPQSFDPVGLRVLLEVLQA